MAGHNIHYSLLQLAYSLFLRHGARVRKPTVPEQLYIDFDGFFAACEEQADRRLQGWPLGVIPFAGAVNSCVIAANTLAKRAGVTTGMAIADARQRCPGIALVPQQPDLYTRIHHRIVAAVLDVIPIDAVCSIDELAATVAPRDVPAALTHQIKQRLRDAVGDHITCSIGCAPNRWLAKIAADLDKPDGLTVLHPRDLPGRLLKTSACMHPFARQLFGWQATNPARRAAALVLEVKGDFCHDIRRMLTELGRAEDYVELSLDGRLTWNPLSATWLDSYSLAYTVVLQALNTGHGGSLTTVHANNAESALSRLASCAMQGGGDLPWDVTCRGVVDGIAMVIHMTRADGRRCVEEAAYVKGYDAGRNAWDMQRLDRVTV